MPKNIIEWIITIFVIVILIIPVLLRLKRRNLNNKCTEGTVGIIRSARQTGIYVNGDPQLRIELDAVGQDGSMFVTSIKKVIPLARLANVVEGSYIPIRFNPQDRSQAIFDRDPNLDRIQELVQRQQALKHPQDFTFEQRMEIVRHGVDKKARLKDVHLTGVTEAGEHEAVVTVQPSAPEFEGRTLTRTTLLSDDMLESLTPGRYIDITVVPHQPELFGLNFSVPFVTAAS